MRRGFSCAAMLLTLMNTVTLSLPCLPVLAQSSVANYNIYVDSLAGGWQNWSWCGVDFGSTEYVHAGADSIKIDFSSRAWAGFALHCDPINTTGYTTLSFWINGGAASGRNLNVCGNLNGNQQQQISLTPYIDGGGVLANVWHKVVVPLASINLGSTAGMTGFWLVDSSGQAQPAFYIDDVMLGNETLPPPAPPVDQAVSVDFKGAPHAINPAIYGLAYPSAAVIADLGITLNRSGGNAASGYNWMLNASNHGSDWYYESLSEGDATPSAFADGFISASNAAGAQAMMTIPMIGWVAKLGPNRGTLGSFSTSKYGAQTGADNIWGNGQLTSGANVTGNDPNDAYVPADSAFQQNWARHFVSALGTAAKGGLKYYILDNEPGIWNQTHRDVHPVGVTYDELKNKTIDYAAKIKAVDPGAQIVGPEEWGWTNYQYSGYDIQYAQANGWNGFPDRAAHGNMDIMPWLLDALHKNDMATGAKSLDVFSLHYYPQGGEYGDDVSTAMQLRRNRSTRSLWDPRYIDETWINNTVQLVPRMKGWVNTYYPGLKTAVTEYNWGAEGHINGATTQADVLGIFGREGLDMATRWTTPNVNTPVYNAYKMYRNVDGSNNGFGDVSVTDTAADPDNVSSFAATRSSDNAQTIMLINKSLTNALPVTLSLANAGTTGAAQVYQLTSTNVITRLADMTLPGTSSETVKTTLPAQSITLLVIPVKLTAPAAPTALTAWPGGGSVALNWTASPGATVYNVKRSVTKGDPYATVGTAATTAYTDINVVNGTTYYYVVSAVSAGGESAGSNEASATPSANAGVVTGLFSTGFDGSGKPAADGSGDIHYSLVSTPNGKSGTAYVTLQKLPIGSGLWMLDTATSKWISPVADESTNVDAPGSYTYQTTFTITGDPGTVKINGLTAGDNAVTAIILNGQTVATNVSGGFQSFSSFVLNSGMLSGKNTLQFVLQNGGPGTNPSGFRCELTSPSSGVVTGPSAPAAPTSLTATGGTGQIALAWTASTNATGYNVKRGVTKGGAYTTVGTSATTSYADTTAVAGTTYYYVVTATGAGGESANSNEASGVSIATPAITGLFSTGLDSSGNPLADGSGDGHYSLVSTPGGKSGTTYVTLQKWPIVNGAWMLDTSASKWISPVADEGACSDAAGDYTYQTTFSAVGDVSKMTISGRIAADNQVMSITLNGQTIASNVTSSFQAWTNFALPGSALQSGTNTVQIVVRNWSPDGNPSGFRCEITSIK